MAKEKAPAFQFYPRDFLGDGNVSGMSLAERGAYITLLCICWGEGSLPMQPVRLANMVGVPRKVFEKLWPAVRVCFREHNGRYVHPRLERERQKQAEFRRKQSDKGKAGATARWGPTDGRGHAPAIAQAIPDDGSSIFNLQIVRT